MYGISQLNYIILLSAKYKDAITPGKMFFKLSFNFKCDFRTRIYVVEVYRVRTKDIII